MAARTLFIGASEGTGSGFFVVDPSFGRYSEDPSAWYVLTNAHVVGSDSSVEITWYTDMPTIWARVIGRDEEADVAILDARPTDFMEDGLSYLAIHSPQVYAGDGAGYGDEVIVAGFPGGLSDYAGEFSITKGVVSSPSVLINGVSHVKTDAAINPGNSGGPLMTTNGKIIGINTSKFVDAAVDNIGYAVTMGEVFSRFEFLKNGGNLYVPTPTPEAQTANYPDGSYLAVLTWVEGGETRYNTENDAPCVERVTETNLSDGRSQFEWEINCEFTGYESGGGFYIDIDGTTYQMAEITLDSRPY